MVRKRLKVVKESCSSFDNVADKCATHASLVILCEVSKGSAERGSAVSVGVRLHYSWLN